MNLISVIFVIFIVVVPSFAKPNKCDPNIGWAPSSSPGASLIIEGFEDSSDWQKGQKDERDSISLKTVQGVRGKALRIEYKLPVNGDVYDLYSGKGGWVYISKPIDIKDFKNSTTVSFQLRAEGAPNILELKILDGDGGYFIRKFLSGTKTSSWHKEEFHIDELVYGWGGKNSTLDPPFKLEFSAVNGWSSINGGAGWIELDDMQLNNINPHIEICMNQVGFYPDGPKNAVVRLVNDNKKIDAVLNFKIISLDDGLVKYSGTAEKSKILIWDAQYWNVVFDPFKTPGKYKLQVSLKNDSQLMTVESYPFEIGENILSKRVGQSQFEYIKSTRYPEKTKHVDPVPGGYIDTEGCFEKWMTTTPAWEWGMSHYYNLMNNEISFSNYDPYAEIAYCSRFCMDMQDKTSGGVYFFIGACFPGLYATDMTPEEDTKNGILSKELHMDVATSDLIGLVEAAEASRIKDPSFSKRCLDSAVQVWKYISIRTVLNAQDVGMYLWGNVLLYKQTREALYLDTAKQLSQKLLPLQFLDYKLSDQGVFGKFFNDGLLNNFNYQHKFVHSMGMLTGLIDLAEILSTDDPLREKIIFHLDCFAYGYLKQTTGLNPYGLVAQALEPNDKTGKMDLYWFSSPKTVIQSDHGLNCDIMAMGIIAVKYARLTKNSLFARIAMNQIDWVLGKNPIGFCMVSGIGKVNPPVMQTAYGYGPIRGAIPNGYVGPDNLNYPKWNIEWNSTEYWKVHTAMLIGLIAELESDKLGNPFNYPEKPFDLEGLYRKIDQYRSKNKIIPMGISYFGTKVNWTEASSDSISCKSSFSSEETGTVLKLEYHSEKPGTYVALKIDGGDKINKGSVFSVRLKTTRDRNAVLEFSLVDDDGSTFMKKISCGNLAAGWEDIRLDTKDFIYAWGGDKNLDHIKTFNVAIALSAESSGSVLIDNIKY